MHRVSCITAGEGGSIEDLPEVKDVPRTYCTHWCDKIFIGDHKDAPKVTNVAGDDQQ
jgi:hypothetical protein